MKKQKNRNLNEKGALLLLLWLCNHQRMLITLCVLSPWLGYTAILHQLLKVKFYIYPSKISKLCIILFKVYNIIITLLNFRNSHIYTINCIFYCNSFQIYKVHKLVFSKKKRGNLCKKNIYTSNWSVFEDKLFISLLITYTLDIYTDTFVYVTSKKMNNLLPQPTN